MKKNLYSLLVKNLVFFSCSGCIYHRSGYFMPCKFFQFKVNDKSMIWHSKRYFNCDSKNVIYILMCNTCEWFYLGQTTSLKQRIRKHKSDVFHPQNSFCEKCSEHLRYCNRMKEPFFRIYPFFMRIKRNSSVLKKNVSLWNGNHSWILIICFCKTTFLYYFMWLEK